LTTGGAPDMITHACRSLSDNAVFRRKFLARIFARSLTAACLIALPLAAPTAMRAAGAGRQTLVIAYHQGPSDLDPATSFDGPSAAVLRGAYEGLVRLKGSSTTQVEGVLATSWTSSQGGKVWTFKLRHNVKFHDGTPFNAAATKASIDRSLKINQGPAFIEGTFVTASGVQVVDPYTLRFTLKAPTNIFLSALAAEWGNWIISPTAFMGHQTKSDMGHAWLQSHDAGTGPYTISQLVPGQSTTLTAFPGYWGGWSGKHVTTVILNAVTADATRREEVEKGDADLTESLTPQDLSAMTAESGLSVNRTYGMRNLSLVMTEAGPLATPAARQAMGYAFDYKAYINDLLKGYARQAQGPLPRTFLGHDSSLPLYTTDLTKAKALLQQAGVAPGTQMTMWYQGEDETTHAAAEVMQGQLAQIGINLKIENHDASSFIGMFYGNTPAAQRPNFFVWYWYPDYNDPGDWLYPQYYSKLAGSAGSNGGFYHNAQVDKLLDKAAILADTKQRLALYNQIQHIVTWDDPASVFLTDLPEAVAYRKTLHGYYLNPVYTASFDFYNLWKS
jgi:peptide/nickel transport system substrate-binding protein